MTHRRTATALTLVLALGACSSNDTTAPTTTASVGAYGAQVASYDLAADGPQRFLVGLIASDGGLVVGGEVTLAFRFYGADETETAQLPDGELRQSDVTAVFTPVAAGVAPPAGEGPRLRDGQEGVGVYEADDISFEDPGFWSVTVTGTVAGEDLEVTAAFEVAAAQLIVNAGDPAPRTENLLPGDPDAPVKAIDSRAEDDGTVPDPLLHRRTVAQAIAAGQPTVVVISTPVFCVSRFCGPITDAIEAMAASYDGRASFVHIEVWRDFEANAINSGAAEWIYPDTDVDPSEPWVFLVGADGTVVQRWDNVANVADVEAALQAQLS